MPSLNYNRPLLRGLFGLLAITQGTSQGISRSSSSAVLLNLWYSCSWEGVLAFTCRPYYIAAKGIRIICNENVFLPPLCAWHMIQLPSVLLHQPTYLSCHKYTDPEPGRDLRAVTRTLVWRSLRSRLFWPLFPILIYTLHLDTWRNLVRWFSVIMDEIQHLPQSLITGTPALAYAQSAIFISSSYFRRPALSTTPKNPTPHPISLAQGKGGSCSITTRTKPHPRIKGRYHSYTCLTQVYPLHLSKFARISAWIPGDGTGTTGSLSASTC